MLVEDRVFIGVSNQPEYLLLKYGNRHGLITGATGTGKTVTLQGLAEGFSRAGVPVFLADVKGDLAGIAEMGDAEAASSPSAPRTSASTISRMTASRRSSGTCSASRAIRCARPSPRWARCCSSRILDLNDTQEGVLNVAFKFADDNGLLLLDLKDLRALLVEVAEALGRAVGHLRQCRDGDGRRGAAGAAGARAAGRGEISSASGRSIISDLMRTSTDGRGMVSILAADQLMQSPRLYATFLLWMLSELFEELPEVGDPAKPQAGVLLRRGASAVRRRAQGAGRQGRAGGQADPLEGRRRLFLHAEPDRHSRRGAVAAVATACSTRCAPTRRATRRR